MLHSSPRLAAAPDFSQQQLETLTRSVEQKKQQLEDDIQDYIRRKQDELRSYERELIAQFRSMDGLSPIPGSHSHGADCVADTAPLPNHSAASTQPPEPTVSPPAAMDTRTKQNRVHKREKELCGIVTPFYLPLLEAQAPPAKRRKEKKRQQEERDSAARIPLPSPAPSEASAASRDADEARESRSGDRDKKTARGESSSGSTTAEDATESESPGAGKKPRRTPRKSSLRNSNTPKSRRKRVSIVINDRVVLPADNVFEHPLTSPSEAGASVTSGSAVSVVDDVIDPRLIDASPAPVHSGPVHHSLPYPITLPNPTASPTRHSGHSLSDSPPPLEYEPPQTATRTFLDPSPPEVSPSLPQQASAAPIYANEPELEMEEEELRVEQEDDFDVEAHFETYVGGLSGSNVDDVNQSGSYGYPSSLGASYLESYMKSRPLSVRIAAAEEAELQEKEKRKLIHGDNEEERSGEMEADVQMTDDGDDDMDVIGSMEGF